MATFQRYARVRPSMGGGGGINQRTFPEAASQSFKRGDFLTLSSGKVAVAVASGNTVAANTKILGMALQDASGVTDTEILVAIADDNTEFLLPVYHGTPASAVTAIAQVGTAYELVNQTTGNGGFGYDISDSTDAKVIVQALDPTNSVGEQYGASWVKVVAAQRTLG